MASQQLAVAADEAEHGLDAGVGVVLWKACHLAQQFVVVHDDVYRAPQPDCFRLALDGLLGDADAPEPVVNVLADVF